MGGQAKKTIVTLGGIQLAASSPVVWAFTAGTQPFTSVFTVHEKVWKRSLSRQVGLPLRLKIVDARGVTVEIEHVYILHTVPSDSPHRVSFVAADRRWLWSYELVARDYNMTRKTGDRTSKLESLPVENRVVVDTYDYLPYSLHENKRWSAKDAIADTLRTLVGSDFRIERFPHTSREGIQLTLQNISLRDQGDVALARLLSFVPGVDVYIDKKGTAIVYDASDLAATDGLFRNLPAATWEGESVAFVEREQIRPSTIVLHYPREVETVFDFSDDYGGTRALPDPDAPFLENVLPTVDPVTTISRWDPVARTTATDQVPPGVWVPVQDWLAAMDAAKPSGSLPWTFDTIKRHWLTGDLEGVLGARGLDLDETANVALRVQALKQHFRQTFRINRRYMERIRSLRAIRVALLDPVTGARAPAAVWSQACIVPTTKGKRIASRRDPETAGVYRNVDYLAPSKNFNDTRLVDTGPGPARVNLVDADLGIFRVEWISSPYGTVESFIPCHLVGEGNAGSPQVPVRNLAKQDTAPMGAGLRVESGTNGIFLRDTLDLKAVLTIVPAAPNNTRQFHRHTVSASDVEKMFRSDFRIAKGLGPALHVFVPPGESTARFAWSDDAQAPQTLKTLLGLDEDDPDRAGIEGVELPGFVLINEQRQLLAHARAVAAEILAAYADNVMGNVATVLPRTGKVALAGNVASATIRVAAAPSARVDISHAFPGQQRPIPRFALLSDTARAIILGEVPFR